MVITGAEIKIGIDVLSRIFKTIQGVSNSKKEKLLISKIYQELLLGEKAELDKVDEMVRKLEKLGSISSDFVKVKGTLANVRGVLSKKPAAKKAAAKKPTAKKAVAKKKPAAKKGAAKKPAVKKSSAKKLAAKKLTAK